MCLQHKIHLIGLTETHLNTIEKEKQEMNQGVGYLLLNSLITTSKGSKGTALLHFLNNKRKRCITNTNLVPGHLQWTRFYSRNMPINILTVYLSGRREANDIDDDVFEHIIEVLTECQDEQVVIMGDFNINSHNPSSTRDKQWLELMNSFQMYEHKVTGNFSYVRRYENQISRSRPDHIFVSKHIRVVREQMLAPISKNEHLPFFVDLEFQSNLSWKPSVSKNSKTKIIEYLNNSNFAIFDDLARALSDQIDKYGKFNDRLGIQSIYSSLKNRIEELEQSLLTSIQDFRTIQCSKLFTMYHFDQLTHNKQIDWKQINFNDSQIVQHFKDKFTSSNQTPTFSLSPSTVSIGPQIMNLITLNDLENALSRMKSNTPGVDFIPHDIIKGLNDSNKKLLVDKFNESIENWNIPITPTELDVNDIGLLNFADDMNIVCNRHVKYNDRLDDIDTWLSQ
nr:unnamed protein product [Naegleria fowleri]